MYINFDECEDTLLCPNCESTCLHHQSIEVFDRKEDDQTGTHTLVESGDIVSKHSNLSGNPSRRRDGIKIHFMCEECDAKPVLTIAQHKGQTLIVWD